MKIKKRMRLTAMICLFIMLASLMTGCGGREAAENSESVPEAETAGTINDESEAKIDDGHRREEPVFFSAGGPLVEDYDTNEAADTVSARYKDMTEAWSFTTDPYQLTENAGPFEIGLRGNCYYVESGGSIYCLNKDDGSLVWKNTDERGAVTGSAFDDEGNLYMCCMYHPILSVVSPEGREISSIDEFTFTNASDSPSEFYWPSTLRLDGDRVKIHFDSNDRCISLDPASGTAELLPEGSRADIADGVPGLERFMGGWGSLDCRPTDDCATAEFTDKNGKLKVNFAVISGGGWYLVFDEDDISFDGDTMTCVNGLLVSDGPDMLNCKMVAEPSGSAEGGYKFVIDDEMGLFKNGGNNDYVYTKVGTEPDELSDWVNEHHEPL